ncbi:MAG: hypothetical protein ACRCZY_06275 [Phocaeicola sp.]
MKVLVRWVFIFLVLLLSSCKTQYVPYEVTRERIEYRDKLQRDSIYISNSTNTRQKGDTVYIDRIIREYRNRSLKDTIRIETRDSIPIPYPVERHLSRWQQFKIEIEGIAIGAIVVLLVIVIWLLYKRFKKFLVFLGIRIVFAPLLVINRGVFLSIKDEFHLFTITY